VLVIKLVEHAQEIAYADRNALAATGYESWFVIHCLLTVVVSVASQDQEVQPRSDEAVLRQFWSNSGFQTWGKHAHLYHMTAR
jgi:hypothetical protein